MTRFLDASRGELAFTRTLSFQWIVNFILPDRPRGDQRTEKDSGRIDLECTRNARKITPRDKKPLPPLFIVHRGELANNKASIVVTGAANRDIVYLRSRSRRTITLGPSSCRLRLRRTRLSNTSRNSLSPFDARVEITEVSRRGLDSR